MIEWINPTGRTCAEPADFAHGFIQPCPHQMGTTSVPSPVTAPSPFILGPCLPAGVFSPRGAWPSALTLITAPGLPESSVLSLRLLPS